MAGEKVRKRFDAKKSSFKAVPWRQGRKEFQVDERGDDPEDLIHYCVKVLEVPYIRGHIGAN